MCDYSLESYRSRPAQVGEKYVISRFESGSIGLASPGDCSTAVCVSCDTRLRLEGIPQDQQQKLGVGPVEDVTVIHLESRAYRDAVRFENGLAVSFQQLAPGITATLTMSLERSSRDSEATSVAEASQPRRETLPA